MALQTAAASLATRDNILLARQRAKYNGELIPADPSALRSDLELCRTALEAVRDDAAYATLAAGVKTLVSNLVGSP